MLLFANITTSQALMACKQMLLFANVTTSLDRSYEMPVNAQISKASELTVRDLSTVLTDCCTFCMSRRNGATGRIPNGKKSTNITSSNQATVHGNKVLEDFQGKLCVLSKGLASPNATSAHQSY
ncbi:hypothetical protein AVEN_215687-1 [Araneus ventricosus]|uniref:Uncharacterized protein n=1 Tax=Araneus ventricosus TaxID=182803 RepID=A0A4Y2S4A2_ARAVE|nr:hypothetical protein AVEN_215687-1 [Araneus ventricosus]